MSKSNWLEDKKKADARVHWQKENKLNSWGYTISPAPKDYDNNEIESLRKSIDYYKEQGVNELVLQLKYMGSYCSVYLHKDIEKTKFFSRNGYLIKRLDENKLLDSVREIHNNLFVVPNLEMVVLEGELLPWRALGDSLVDKEYVNYYNLNKDLLNYKKEYYINDKLRTIYNSEEFQQFLIDYKNEDYKTKYKPHIIRQYKSMLTLMEIYGDTYNDEKSLELYKNQLDIFGYSSDTYEYKPFNIIKYCYNDKTEELDNSNLTAFEIINNDKVCVLDLSSDNCYEKAYEFYNEVMTNKHEGIVVKPLKSGLINIAPCFKVRTNHYLQLIYGYKFNQNFDYYLEKRNINRKLAQSIKEYELTNMLFRINRDNLHYNNSEYTNILYSLIDSEKFNKTLDNRL